MTHTFGYQLWFSGAAFILAIALPGFATLILDGVVAVFRGRGMGRFLVAVGVTVAAAGLGATMWKYGVVQGAGVAGLDSIVQDQKAGVVLVLPLASALAVLAFSVRFALSFRGRSSTVQPQSRAVRAPEE